MLDARKILADLERQAGELARDARLDERLADAGSAARRVRDRIETDPAARNVAAGAGGLLLLGLIGTDGGRKLLGNIAKLGLSAGLGALAYRAWAEREGRQAGVEPGAEDIRSSGYFIESERDEAYALALVHALLGAAYADGVIDAQERVAVEAALKRAGADEEDRRALMNDMPPGARIAEIKKGAKTPGHAAQLFAVAAATAGARSGQERHFLDRLAEALDISAAEAEAIRAGL
jgi:uncharacterized membrane protein YebE (DUF533 family)